MVKKNSQHPSDNNLLFQRSYAARQAGVGEDFFIQCEQAGLITSISETGSDTGFDKRTIQRVSLIQRLHVELDLDLETIDLVLHMRSQIIDLQNRLAELERKYRQNERQLLAEQQQLRSKLFPEGQLTDLD